MAKALWRRPKTRMWLLPVTVGARFSLEGAHTRSTEEAVNQTEHMRLVDAENGCVDEVTDGTLSVTAVPGEPGVRAACGRRIE